MISAVKIPVPQSLSRRPPTEGLNFPTDTIRAQFCNETRMTNFIKRIAEIHYQDVRLEAILHRIDKVIDEP